MCNLVQFHFKISSKGAAQLNKTSPSLFIAVLFGSEMFVLQLARVWSSLVWTKLHSLMHSSELMKAFSTYTIHRFFKYS